MPAATTTSGWRSTRAIASPKRRRRIGKRWNSPRSEKPRAPVLALNLLAQGRGDEALAEAAREPHEVFRLWALAIIEHAAGRRTESDTALQELIAKYADRRRLPGRGGVWRARRGRSRLRLAGAGVRATRCRARGDEDPILFCARCTPIRGGTPSCARWVSRTRRKLVAACRRRRGIGHDRSLCPLSATRMYGRCWPHGALRNCRSYDGRRPFYGCVGLG